jgi:hypothetical protein
MESTIEVPLTPNLTNTPLGVAAPANTLLNDLLGALVSHISKAVIEQIQPQLQRTTKIDPASLHDLDSYLDSHIDNWMCNNFDISDYEGDLDLEDKVRDAVEDLDLHRKVRDAVQNMTFEVSVS